MNKWLVIIGVLVIAFIGAVSIFIPSTENFTYSSSVKCPQEAATRFLINKNKWPQWWPGEKKDEHLYTYKNYEYRVNKIMLNAVDITVSDSKDSVRGLLRIIGDTGASTKILWNSEFEFSPNPFTKLSNYFLSKDIKSNITSLVEDSKLFFEKQENLYGMKIQVETVKDSSLVAYIAVTDLYNTALSVQGENYMPFETYFVVGIYYLIIVLIFTWFANRIENKMDVSKPKEVRLA